jgi:hypothetical protein
MASHSPSKHWGEWLRLKQFYETQPKQSYNRWIAQSIVWSVNSPLISTIY